MKYTTIFFDLDDTLIDTRKSGKQALLDIYAHYNLQNYYPSFDDFFAIYNEINLDLWSKYEHNKISKTDLMTQRFKLTLSDNEKLSDNQSLDINNQFMEYTTEKKNPIEGMFDVLDYLNNKYPMYILSNGFEEVQDKKITKAGINKYFKKVILSDQVGMNKPHPKIFNYALNMAGKEASQCIMIGDNLLTDIAGAKNCSIDQVWFNPDNKEHSHEILPTFTINQLPEIKNIL